MRRTFLILLVLVISLFGIGPAWAQSGEPIRIGVPLALTGPLAVNGESDLKGIRLYFDEVGNKLAGRKVVLIVADTAGNPTTGLNKVKMLVERDKVNMIIGIVSSAVAYAIRDYVHNNKIPTMITTAGAKDITLSKKSPYVFRTADDTTQEPMALAYYAARKLGYKTAVAIGDDFAAGREMVAAFSKTFTSLGGKVLKKVWAPLGTTDFSPYITQLEQEHADAVVAMLFGIDGARFLTQSKGYGLRKPIIGQGALISSDVIKASGTAGLGVISAKDYTNTLDNPVNRRYVSAFLKKYQSRPDAWAEQAYIGAKAVGEALKAVGGNIEDTPRFLAALRKVKFQGPAGLVWFDKDQQRVFDVYIRKVERRGKTLENIAIAKIPDVSQHWTPPK